MPKKDEGPRDVAVNRRAYHDYFIDEKLEAGIMLSGPEVKSVRNGRTNLRDGFVRIDGNAAWLENVHISPYTQANVMNVEPKGCEARDRSGCAKRVTGRTGKGW